MSDTDRITVVRDVDLLGQLESIVLTLDEEARIDVLIELDRLGDICKAADPRTLAATTPRASGIVIPAILSEPDWLADDPKLASIFERIARALPGAPDSAGISPYAMLNAYAGLLEEKAQASLLVIRAPVHDPEL